MRAKGRVDGMDAESFEDKFIPTPKALVELYARYFPDAKMDWPMWQNGKWVTDIQKPDNRPWPNIRGPRNWDSQNNQVEK